MCGWVGGECVDRDRGKGGGVVDSRDAALACMYSECDESRDEMAVLAKIPSINKDKMGRGLECWARRGPGGRGYATEASK